MTCTQFRDSAQAYAIGALDSGDRVLMERHLQETSVHEGCAEALAAALDSVAVLDRALPVARPRDQVWQQVERAIASGAAPAKVVALRRSRWSEAVAWSMALAAGIAVLLSYGAAQRLEQRIEEGARQLARLGGLEGERNECRSMLSLARVSSEESGKILALLQQPDARVVAFAPQGARTDRATAIVDAGQGRAYVVSRTLPKIAGKDYQLWIIRAAGAPEPAGFVRAEADGTAVGEFDAKLLSQGVPSALAVSLEPAGGRPAPTEVILVAKL